MTLTTAKREEFATLFGEFIRTFPGTPDGQAHLIAYATAREEARANMDAILAAEAQGADITDRVLAKLLPYADTESNRTAGRWTYIAPALNTDTRIQFEAAGWTQPGDWPQVACAILDFVRHCTEHPEQLREACTAFSDSPYSKGLQAGTLTPILNALRPDDFMLINKKPCQVINYFADMHYSRKLTDYPALNATGKALIEAVAPTMHQFACPDMLDGDLFDMFCHWLVAVKHYHFDENLKLYFPLN